MLKIVDKILEQVQQCIEGNTYKELETEKIELKDLSTGDDWKELYKSICAFLNTNGGIVIIGINENDKNTAYSFKGFSANNESKLKEIPKQFTSDSGQVLDLTDYIRPDLFEIQDFMDGRVCILYIEKLPEDKKYVMFNGIAYERKLTGDHKILKAEVEKQRELRADLELARELRQVEDTSLENLSVDKLNDYIQRLNQGMKVETLKADIPSASSFLERKNLSLMVPLLY
ncbi:ATP-binding protein [Paraflavitalea speifideaquila]|uniref:AlbA family DNA-binding domain-containing protein n=1 Tax=Paraflavitalea speifideaquila TaxID=3076558 RepID=UPI0028E79118|nr:ATP-binding protein [Paraflavitalea speifideiaquila]